MEIFFTSDTHFGHKNIVRGVSEWGGKNACRNFDTLEEHNQTLVDNINNVVKENDILYHLGDWSFGGIDNIMLFKKQLNCKNIHLILGNHDHHIRNNRGGLRGAFLSVNDLLEKAIRRELMILCHYSLRTWHKGAKGSWMLYGHSHNTLSPYHRYERDEDEEDEWKSSGVPEEAFYKTMDVGIDTHPEFRPYHFDEINAIMQKRINLNVDHHDAQTQE